MTSRLEFSVIVLYSPLNERQRSGRNLNIVKHVDLMVFDLDGTLVRSDEDLAAAVNHTLQSVGFSPLDADVIRGFIGDGVQVLVRRALGEHAGDYFDRAMALFTTYYAEHLLDHTTLYPGVPSLLSHFSHKAKVIVTNKRREYAVTIAQRLGIAGNFLEIIGEGSTPYKKPDPLLLGYVMQKWGATPERTVVIGDGVNDILLARNAGALSCAFLGGFTERDALISLVPDLICETIADLELVLN
jgi:phosphoglycolate phosphatase